MINSYLLEKRIKEYEVERKKNAKDNAWKRWKDQQSRGWVSNYRNRIERFITDVLTFARYEVYLILSYKCRQMRITQSMKHYCQSGKIQWKAKLTLAKIWS